MSRSIRYYLYVSEPKVEMLLAQIDPAGRRGDVGVRNRRQVRENEATQESSKLDDLYTRAGAVSWYIENHGSYGSIDEPDQFFGGVALLRWGPFMQPDSPLVYFGGYTERTILGLGGSSRNVIGGSVPNNVNYPDSAAPVILAALREELDDEAVEKLRQEHGFWTRQRGRRPTPNGSRDGDRHPPRGRPSGNASSSLQNGSIRALASPTPTRWYCWDRRFTSR